MEFISKNEIMQIEVECHEYREACIESIMKKYCCDYATAKAEFEVGGILPY